MRALVRLLDALLRRAYGVFEFCDDEDCLLRLQVAKAPYTLHLDGRVVEAGETVLAIHLWNEHVPPIPSAGPDLAWASQMRRLFVESLRAVARRMAHDPRLAGVRAVGGATAVFPPAMHASGVRLMQRLGFTVAPYHRPLGRFGEFWENLYSWWIMWAFSAVSLRQRRLLRLQRSEIWMSVEDFLSRYGADRAQSSE